MFGEYLQDSGDKYIFKTNLHLIRLQICQGQICGLSHMQIDQRACTIL